MDIDTAAIALEQAIANLPEDYPFKDEALEAFCYLIMVKLDWRLPTITILPKGCPSWILIKPLEDLKK